jgi:hypothetical protein
MSAAVAAGASELSILKQTGTGRRFCRHRSVLMVRRRYIQDGSLFRENSAAGLGL